MITGIAHACFMSTDLDRALDFYSKGLSLPLAFEFKEKTGVRTGVYLKIGRRTFIEIFKGELKPRAEGQTYGHICLEVDDINKTVAAIRAKGIEVSAPVLGTDLSWQAWITDPDGNKIELHCYTKESWQAPHLK